jgi:hypothetical protein
MKLGGSLGNVPQKYFVEKKNSLGIKYHPVPTTDSLEVMVEGRFSIYIQFYLVRYCFICEIKPSEPVIFTPK